MGKKLKAAKGLKYAEYDNEQFSAELETELAKPTKVRITTFIDADIVGFLKGQASVAGVGYQTLLNETLREAIWGQHSGRSIGLGAIRQQIQGLKLRSYEISTAIETMESMADEFEAHEDFEDDEAQEA